MLDIDINFFKGIINDVAEHYKNSSLQPLMFDAFMTKALNRYYKKEVENRERQIIEAKNKQKEELKRFPDRKPRTRIPPPLYPMNLELPKSIKDIKEGRFFTGTKINIPKPLQWRGNPLWYKNSTYGINLRFGYQDGDSTRVSTVAFNDSKIHMFLGGVTGFGKSVTLNSLIFAMCMEYPPWELDIVMTDAKVVEFKQYGLNAQLPHITTIGATKDTDYLISILKYFVDRMGLINSEVYSAGYQGMKTANLIEFRNATGAVLPRTVIIMDEVQAMFRNATNKQKEEISSMLDLFSAVGRSAGCHLLLCSQSLGSDINKSTLTNMNMRACLGCNKDVSKTILNNEEGSTIVQKGHLIYNPEYEKEDMATNMHFKVPYLSPDVFAEVSELLIEHSKKLGFKKTLNFYDEQNTIPVSRNPSYIASFPRREDLIYLGEPSYIVDSEYKILSIKLYADDFSNKETIDVDDIEGEGKNHIFVGGSSYKESVRFLIMLKDNIILHPRAENYFMVGRTSVMKAAGLDKLLPKGKIIDKVDNIKCVYYNDIRRGVYMRERLVEFDKKVFQGFEISIDDSFLVLRNAVQSKVPELFTSTNESTSVRRLYLWYKYLLLENGAEDFLGFPTIPNLDKEARSLHSKYFTNNRTNNLYNEADDNLKAKLNNIKNKYETFMDAVNLIVNPMVAIMKKYISYDCINKQLTANSLPVMFAWILVADSIIGFGSSPHPTYIDGFKELMRKGSDLHVIFILNSSTDELMTEIKDYIGYYITDSLVESPYNKLQTTVPATTQPMLGILIRRDKHDWKKFKKVRFDDETFLSI